MRCVLDQVWFRSVLIRQAQGIGTPSARPPLDTSCGALKEREANCGCWWPVSSDPAAHNMQKTLIVLLVEDCKLLAWDQIATLPESDHGLAGRCAPSIPLGDGGSHTILYGLFFLTGRLPVCLAGGSL